MYVLRMPIFMYSLIEKANVYLNLYSRYHVFTIIFGDNINFQVLTIFHCYNEIIHALYEIKN